VIRKKIENIDKFSKQPRDLPFNEERKLTPKDIRLLSVSSDRKKTLEILSKFKICIPSFQEIYGKWSELEKLNNSEIMNHLSDLCREGYKCGRVLFYDWSFIEIGDFYPFKFTQAIKHIQYGRIPHVAIIVKNALNQPSRSHVNGATGTHALHPVKFPIYGAFGNFVELDILPLIPSNVSEEHRKSLQEHFLGTFIRLASEEHPNIVLEWKHLSTFFFGHKGVVANDLAKIDLNSKQTQLCSSYVALVFLKAVSEVNIQLLALGYTEKIKHPFGEHEIIDRVDIPRLLYHWKKLKIMRVVPVDVFASKVFTTPNL
jgi:hypothetical protein